VVYLSPDTYRFEPMPGLLAFHAHPDDEVTSTGGTLATYASRGEQVAVVTATDGAEGEIHNYDDPDVIKPILADVRAREIAAAL
jgi:LmbE family N-acetylglucosaminyl deacetylase